MTPHPVAAQCRDLVRRAVEGRPFLVAVGPLAAGVRAARELIDLGASRVLVIAESRGTGAVEAHPAIEHVDLGIVAGGIVATARAYDAILSDPPRTVRESIDRFDPRREARALVAPFTAIPAVAGRRRLGERREQWVALEDKVVIDELWDEAGVVRAPSRVVPAQRAELVRAASALDRGAGTCWAGDATEGPSGGAEHLRWVHGGLADPTGAVDEAAAFFATHCRRVRVMPFLDGIPCSIHGLVLPEHVLAFRPAEMVVFRRPGEAKLRYAGLATYWDPAPDDRAVLRDVARRVGEVLRERVAYRGAFTVDGVMTAEGFRPTELNARAGAGFFTLDRSCVDLPLVLLEMLLRDGAELECAPQDLETIVVESADAVRGGGGWTVVPTRIARMSEHQVLEGEAGFELVEADPMRGAAGSALDGAAGTLVVGPSAVGGFVRFTPNRERTPSGPSLAPRVAAVFALADRRLGTSIGPLEPARALR